MSKAEEDRVLMRTAEVGKMLSGLFRNLKERYRRSNT